MHPAREPEGRRQDWTLTRLVVAIEGGDHHAWPVLIRRLEPAVQATLRRFDVDEELRADAASEVWRQLFERLDTVREPERLHGWVSVVAANQLRSMLRRASNRHEVVAEEVVIDSVNPVEERDSLLESEIRDVLERAVAKLSDREQTVIRSRLLTDEPLPLTSMSQRCDIPTGSIGPTLGRSLRKLRQDPQLRVFFGDAETGRAA